MDGRLVVQLDKPFSGRIEGSLVTSSLDEHFSHW